MNDVANQVGHHLFTRHTSRERLGLTKQLQRFAHRVVPRLDPTGDGRGTEFGRAPAGLRDQLLE
jgi:hypothetical protein